MTAGKGKQMKPEVGCGAAIMDEQGRLLLMLRLKEPEANAWGLPGGKIDMYEPAESAICREVMEELGITIEVLQLACISEIMDGGDGRHWVSPVYEARLVHGEPQLMEPEKHGGWNWFAPDALPASLTTPTLQYLEARKTRTV